MSLSPAALAWLQRCVGAFSQDFMRDCIGASATRELIDQMTTTTTTDTATATTTTTTSASSPATKRSCSSPSFDISVDPDSADDLNTLVGHSEPFNCASTMLPGTSAQSTKGRFWAASAGDAPNSTANDVSRKKRRNPELSNRHSSTAHHQCDLQAALSAICLRELAGMPAVRSRRSRQPSAPTSGLALSSSSSNSTSADGASLVASARVADAASAPTTSADVSGLQDPGLRRSVAISPYPAGVPAAVTSDSGSINSTEILVDFPSTADLRARSAIFDLHDVISGIEAGGQCLLGYINAVFLEVGAQCDAVIHMCDAAGSMRANFSDAVEVSSRDAPTCSASPIMRWDWVLVVRWRLQYSVGTLDTQRSSLAGTGSTATLHSGDISLVVLDFINLTSVAERIAEDATVHARTVSRNTKRPRKEPTERLYPGTANAADKGEPRSAFKRGADHVVLISNKTPVSSENRCFMADSADGQRFIFQNERVLEHPFITPGARLTLHTQHRSSPLQAFAASRAPVRAGDAIDGITSPVRLQQDTQSNFISSRWSDCSGTDRKKMLDSVSAADYCAVSGSGSTSGPPQRATGNALVGQALEQRIVSVRPCIAPVASTVLPVDVSSVRVRQKLVSNNWTCPVCSCNDNWPRTLICINCKERSRPFEITLALQLDGKPSDWICTACNAVTYASAGTTQCFACGNGRKEILGAADGTTVRGNSLATYCATNIARAIALSTKDWKCSFCQAYNWAKRLKCEQCLRYTRPEEVVIALKQRGLPSDWECSCGNYCFATKQKCAACGLSCIDSAVDATLVTAPEPIDKARTNWSCVACGTQNRPKNLRCRQCSDMTRPADVSRALEEQHLPSDWICSTCSTFCFASRRTCFHCSAGVPSSANPLPTSVTTEGSTDVSSTQHAPVVLAATSSIKVVSAAEVPTLQPVGMRHVVLGDLVETIEVESGTTVSLRRCHVTAFRSLDIDFASDGNFCLERLHDAITTFCAKVVLEDGQHALECQLSSFAVFESLVSVRDRSRIRTALAEAIEQVNTKTNSAAIHFTPSHFARRADNAYADPPVASSFQRAIAPVLFARPVSCLLRFSLSNAPETQQASQAMFQTQVSQEWGTVHVPSAACWELIQAATIDPAAMCSALLAKIDQTLGDVVRIL